METASAAKSGMLFDAIARSEDFYRLPVECIYRSRVNVPFRIYTDGNPSPELEGKFLKEAAEQGLIQLKGHRSVGGLRASLYNAVTLEQTSKLVNFMKRFLVSNRLKN